VADREDTPFEIVFAAQIADQVRALPEEARLALGEALERIAMDPWAEPRYHERLPPEMRSAAYSMWGFVTFVIGTKRHIVIVTHVTWAG
jgi:hypothetical protein